MLGILEHAEISNWLKQLALSQRFPLKERVSAVQTSPLPPFQPAGHPEIHLFLKVTSLACI